MKKTSKILLSAFVVSSMFLTMRVHAEEQAPSKNQNTTIAQENTTTKSLKDLTKTEFNHMIPNTIEINVTKTDYANYIIRTNFQETEEEDMVEKALERKLIEIFHKNGITNVSSSDFSVGCELGSGIGAIENGSIGINGLDYVTDFTIQYAKESNYSEQDEASVKNAVESIQFAKYSEEYDGEISFVSDAVFTIYNIGDEESASKWTENTYDFRKLLNDTSITIKKTFGVGGIGGGTPWGIGTILYFYKNDILYDIKHIMNMGAYGTILENKTPVNMARLEADDEIYKAMAKELESKGFKNILGCYELTAYGPTTNNMKISFNLGNDYNDKEIQILHKKKDNTYETFKTTVIDGKAKITVSEFSPFMIALTENATIENENKIPNNVQTSSIDIVLYLLLALGSFVGMTSILVNKKKIV